MKIKRPFHIRACFALCVPDFHGFAVQSDKKKKRWAKLGPGGVGVGVGGGVREKI
mgnify:CR=1 FL=1